MRLAETDVLERPRVEQHEERAGETRGPGARQHRREPILRPDSAREHTQLKRDKAAGPERKVGETQECDVTEAARLLGIQRCALTKPDCSVDVTFGIAALLDALFNADIPSQKEHEQNQEPSA